MVSWLKVTDIDGVNHGYFSEYQNENPGLLTRIAINMQPPVLRTLLPDCIKTDEKFFYVCVACKDIDADRMAAIFKKYNPYQDILSTSIRYKNEKGFILWMAYNAEAQKNLDQLFETISNSERLGEEGIPESIKKLVKDKMVSCLT